MRPSWPSEGPTGFSRNTPSIPRKAERTVSTSRRSPVTAFTPAGSFFALSALRVRTLTSALRAASSATTCDPTVPVPPRTRTFIGSCLPFLSDVTVSGHRCLDQAVRRLRRHEHVVLVRKPERREIHREVVLVRHRQTDLFDFPAKLENGFPHRIHRVLDRPAVVCGERIEERLPHLAPETREVPAAFAVEPARGERGREDPVLRVGERRISVAQESGERGAGALEKEEVVQAGTHRDAFTGVVDGGRPGLAARSEERAGS